VAPAIEALLERRRAAGLEIASDLAMQSLEGLEPALETTIYRVLQEALTNVAKHAEAATVHVLVCAADTGVVVEVRDDGPGFNTAASTSGFGLAGMRERVYLAGGQLEIESGPEGTTVRALLPISLTAAATWSGAHQVAS
jgi:signal transduction histidine kinase